MAAVKGRLEYSLPVLCQLMRLVTDIKYALTNSKPVFGRNLTGTHYLQCHDYV